MNIALLEPFFTGSHKSWAENLKQKSKHNIQIFSLPGRHWKWRMHGGAVSLANAFMASSFQPDGILATDMLDLAVFLGLTKTKTNNVPTGIYFHENQLSYPWSENDPDLKLKRDNHYGFINFSSAVAADQLFFNSFYHKKSFLEALPRFLNQFPDFQLKEMIASIEKKSTVLYLGNLLEQLAVYKSAQKYDRPVILWNHRWEYDKNPATFFDTLLKIKKAGIPFYLILLGKSYQQIPAIFKKGMQLLKDEIIHSGYAPSFEEYVRLLWQADFFPVTNKQDFFGASVVEALFCDTYPLLPNRLAYPEHIPKQLRKKYLYENDDQLLEQLKTLLAATPIPKIDPDCKSHLKRYDWNNLIPIYDQKLSDLCKKHT